jgi:hypothetical protein
MKKIFYEKVGRRYVPVSEYDNDLLDAFPKGAHLVMSYPGGQSRAFNIDPNYAALIAAARVAQEPMHKAIHDAAKMKKDQWNNVVLSNEQFAAWEHFKEVMGERGNYVYYNSVHDIAEAGIKALEEEAAKLMKHPAVQDAYEKFQLVCKLVKEKQHDQT